MSEFVIPAAYVKLAYLLAAILFILGLKGLGHPRTAVRGNLLGALGMVIAVAVTLLARGLSFPYIALGIGIGAVIGATAALRSPRHRREVSRFFRAHPVPAAHRALRQAMERFDAYAQLRAHAGEGIETYLAG